jgi:hypothetical protein
MAAEGSSRSRSRGLVAGLSALVYQAREPPDVVTADGNCVLTKRVPQGGTPWFGRSFSRVSDGRTTTMSPRTECDFRPVEASGALPEAAQMSHGRCVLVSTARVAATAIETIAFTVIGLSRIAGLCSGSLNHPGR